MTSVRPADRQRTGAGSGDAATFWRCSGCGFRVPDGEPARLRCPNARPGDDVDHVLERALVPGLVEWPASTEAEANPFIRYRTLFHAWHAARRMGWTDAGYVALATRLNAAIVAVDGRGFRETPLREEPELARAVGMEGPGSILVKDETRNVSGSHKGRPLFGTLLELEVAEATALGPAQDASAGISAARPSSDLRRLAIASCGNAALAAAVVARAVERPLDVFVPYDANRAVLARLEQLGAAVSRCPRRPGEIGDPTYLRLLEAVRAGAVPFACMGNLNGFSVEGTATVGWELVDQFRARPTTVDRIFIQAGAGGLAAACMLAFDDASALGVDVVVPRLHIVQTEGAWPLARAYDLVAARVLTRAAPREVPPAADREARSMLLREVVATGPGHAELEDATRHRSAFMWPWEPEPHSAASGILDDEAYDWFAVVRAMLQTGGYPVVVPESTVLEANHMARRTTEIDVDHTGSAGLAGLLELRRRGVVDPKETIALLFTGVRRDAEPVDAAKPMMVAETEMVAQPAMVAEPARAADAERASLDIEMTSGSDPVRRR
jgi:threonine synthase